MSLTRPDASQIAYDPPLFVRDRLERVIFPEQYGADNTGTTDSSTAIQAALDAAGSSAVVMFKPGATYLISNIGVDFPAGCRVITNGATLRVSSTSTTNAFLFTVAGNAQIDHLNISVPAGIRRDRCVTFTGDDIHVGQITVISADQQTLGTESNDVAVKFLNCNRVRVGTIRVSKYERAVTLEDSTDIQIQSLDISSYVRGLYITECSDVFVGKSRIATASPNAGVVPGHNGVLINSTTDDGTRNVTLQDFTIEDAGEHGIRFGGEFQVSNVHIVRPRVKNVGASGIKLQGDDGGTATNYHRRINIINPVIEDCGDNGVNDCGIYFFLAVECNIVNPIIRKEGKTYSASYGIRIRSCVGVNIVNPTVLNAEFEGIWLDGSVNDNNQVAILGGRSALNGRDGLRLTYDQGTHRRFRAEGLLLEANGGYGCNININGGAGTLLDAYLDLVFEANTSGSLVSDTTAVTVRGRDDQATPPATTVRNGSIWQTTAGLNHRKAGAWVAL